MVECHRCGQQNEFGQTVDWLLIRQSLNVCKDCWEILARQRRYCHYCGRRERQGTAFTCSRCWTPVRERAAKVIYRANRRAFSHDGIATLTLVEWESILDHFYWRCAYCPSPYAELEHIVPLSGGGGTTARNCVPACHDCNQRKSSRSIEELRFCDPTFANVVLAAHMAALAFPDRR